MSTAWVSPWLVKRFFLVLVFALLFLWNSLSFSLASGLSCFVVFDTSFGLFEQMLVDGPTK